MKNKMRILVVGASGATGRLLVEQLLNRGQNVKVIIRFLESLPENFKNQDQLSVIQGSLLDLSVTEISQYAKGCDAVVSCLGHNLSFKGIYYPPWRLVTSATRRICEAIKKNSPETPVKFVLMNTTGNSNRDLQEQISFGQKIVIWLLRLLLPPHVDNEQAADYLRTEVGQRSGAVEWVVVRPDTLTNENKVTEYDVHPSPIRGAIFDPGVTSRINVGHFMAELITNEATWSQWKGKMPVIYNKASSK